MSKYDKKKIQDDTVAHTARDLTLMRKAGGPSGSKMGGIQSAFGGLSGSSGAALPGPIMRKFESSLGADLSGVRVHTGGASAKAASAVSAKAFATGNDIHFNSGQYNPSSGSGQELLAHEVAHTVQQSGGSGRAQFKLNVSQPGDPLELEADRAAANMVAGRAATVSRAPNSSTVQRRVEQVYDPSDEKYKADQGYGNYNPYADVHESEDGNKVKWKETYHYPEKDVEVEHEGLNVYGPDAKAAGYQPSPDDPYGQDPSPFDWSAAESIGPENPGTWAVTFAPKQPAPVQKNGKNRVTSEPEVQTIPVSGAQRAFAQSCVEAFRGPYDTAKSSWDGMTGHVKAFLEAGKDPIFQEGGLNWLNSKAQAKEKKGQSMSQIANQSKVGLGPDGKATSTVKEVTEMSKEQMEGLKHKESDGSIDKLQALAGDVEAKNEGVKAAYDTAANEVSSHQTAMSALATAGKGININNMKKDTDAEKAKVKQAEREKAEVMIWVNLVMQAYDGGVALAKDPIAAGLGAVNKQIDAGTRALFTHLFTSNFDKKIKTGAGKIAALASKISSLSDEIRVDDLKNAASAATEAAESMRIAKAKIGPALRDADKAYRDFADQAAKQAGKGGNKKRADEVRAALEALPKIALVAQYAKAVVSAISMPGYNEKAGKGMLGAANTPANFYQSVAEMRGYQTEFTSEMEHWTEARTRCEAIAKSYGLND